jgi:hypothetical protein
MYVFLEKINSLKTFYVVKFHCQIIEIYENLLICRLEMLFKGKIAVVLLFCKKRKLKKKKS